MQFRMASESSFAINITPLLDVVFLLLIFFMVTAQFSKHSYLQIELPQAGQQAVEQHQDTLTIKIDRQGQYYLNEKKVISLKEALARQPQPVSKLPLKIAADGHTPHQFVVSAIAIAQEIGFTGLQIMTQKVHHE